MTEIKDARELIASITRHRMFNDSASLYAWWAPGDMTRYRVAHVVLTPGVDTQCDTYITALIVMCGRETVVIEKPGKMGHNYGLEWTAQRWLDRFGDRYAGWWAGIRPLLAALNWTPHGQRDTGYRPHSAVEIGQLLR